MNREVAIAKEEKTKVYLICALIGIITGLCAYFFIEKSIWYVIIAGGCWFFTARYCIFGSKQWYIPKTFKHHIGIRWAVLILLLFYTGMSIAILIVEKPEHFEVLVYMLPMFLVLAIQSVRNGKRAGKYCIGERLC